MLNNSHDFILLGSRCVYAYTIDGDDMILQFRHWNQMYKYKGAAKEKKNLVKALSVYKFLKETLEVNYEYERL